MRILVLLLWILPLPGLMAQAPQPADFFGPGAFAPEKGAPLRGVLTSSFTTTQALPFLDFNNSDPGGALQRFDFTETGLVLNPAGKGHSCEVEIDIGLSHAEISLRLVELDLGGSIAFHLRALTEDAQGHKPEYLILVVRDEPGNGRIRVLLRNRHGFAESSSTNFTNHDFAQPAAFKLSLQPEKFKAGFAGVELTGALKLKGGFGLALAASDARARARDLVIEADLDQAWWEDAAARLEARRALARLKEYSLQGVLAGICRATFVSAAADLGQYSETQLRARREALEDSNFGQRYLHLREIALDHPKLALAQHEAGVAALLAGYTQSASELLASALEIRPNSLTRLALAETALRLRDLDAAQRHLTEAKPGLNESLAADLELFAGRVAAARGDLVLAARNLKAAHEKWPGHQELAAFSASASELAQPESIAAHARPGPLGATVLSNLDEANLLKVLGRLKPYEERIRYWLPGLGEKVEGTLAIYAGPADYLRAALIVAGDSLDNVAGMFLPAGILGKPSVIACRAFGEDELLRTLVHELWHLALHSQGTQVPPWLNEGMAVYLSAGDAGKDGALSFARLPSEFARIQDDMAEALTNPEAAMRALSARPDTFYTPHVQRLNYAMAWVVAWYLAERTAADEKRLRTLLSGDDGALEALKGDIAKLLPSIAKALKDRKLK